MIRQSQSEAYVVATPATPKKYAFPHDDEIHVVKAGTGVAFGWSDYGIGAIVDPRCLAPFLKANEACAYCARPMEQGRVSCASCGAPRVTNRRG